METLESKANFDLGVVFKVRGQRASPVELLQALPTIGNLMREEKALYDSVVKALQEELPKWDGVNVYEDQPEIERIVESGKYLWYQTTRNGVTFLHWNDKTVTIL